MTLVHLHLILNNVPVIGMVAVVLLLGYAMMRRSEELQKTALGAAVLVALVTPGAYFTGEPAEHAVKGLPGVTKQLIDRHEDAALLAFIAISATGLVALALLVKWRSPALRTKGVRAAMFLGLVALVLVIRAAAFGGEVRHTEIRSGSAAAGSPESGARGDD